MYRRIWQLTLVLTLSLWSISSLVAEESRTIGFLQGTFTNDQSQEVINNEFAIHRARIGMSGKINDQIGYNVVLGAVEPPDREAHLVNAFVDFEHAPWLKVRVGQFLVLFGLEGPQPITLNPAIERATATKKLNPLRMFRDRGLQVSGKSKKIGCTLAITNGTGANTSEDNDAKDILGRIGISPVLDLNLGISVHFGNHLNGSEDDLTRERYGADIEFIHGPVRLRGEGIYRHDEQDDDSERTSTGWYVLSAYRFASQVEGILRYEQYDPDTSVPNDRLDIATLGVNYYFLKHTRLSVNYEHKDDKASPETGNRLTGQLQIVF